MAITTRNSVFTKRASGLSWYCPFAPASIGGSSGGTSTTGFCQALLAFHSLSSPPGTLVSIPLPAGMSSQVFCVSGQASNSSTTSPTKTMMLGLAYKLGTLDQSNAAATPYDGFTHNANFTAPITRTYHGVSGQPIVMMPLSYITTTGGATNPAFILKATAGTAGYKNQANSAVIGTKTYSEGQSAVSGSTYVLRLEDGDSGIQDITQMSVTVKDATLKSTIFGFEPIMPVTFLGNCGGIYDGMFSAIQMSDIMPGTPTSGSLTIGTDVFLCVTVFGSTAAQVPNALFNCVVNA